jgi:hypothetical protein
MLLICLNLALYVHFPGPFSRAVHPWFFLLLACVQPQAPTPGLQFVDMQHQTCKAVVILTRHGARSPAANVMEGSSAAVAEVLKWGAVVPSASHDFEWHERFPVQPPSSGTEVEPHEWPWAQLSFVGVSQVKTVGAELVGAD